jgi:peptidoglycan/LPS O-acetylase OafA/YrhL
LSNRIESLDSLRGIASLIVVIFHCLLSYNLFYNAHYFNDFANDFLEFFTLSPLRLAWAGKEAVLLFFVLSGFVLSIPFQSGIAPKYGEYVVRRFFRIYLPYIIVMLISVLLVTMFAGYKDIEGFSQVYENRWAHSISLRDIIAYIIMYDINTSNNVNGVVWTLYHEMRISLIFPVFLFLINKLKFGKALTLSLVVNFIFYIFLGTASNMSNAISGTISTLFMQFQESIFYCTFFIFGAILSKYRSNLTILNDIGALSRITLWVLTVILINNRWLDVVFNIKSSQLEDFVSMIGILLLFTLVLTSNKANQLLTKKPLLWLGQVSFSLYLIHIPVLMLTTIFLSKLMPLELTFILVPFICLPIAHYTHKYIEIPSNKWGRLISKKIGRINLISNKSSNNRKVA